MKRNFFQHPSALVETDVVGAGTRIWAYAHVMKGARIGRNCNLGDHAFVETGARIGNNVTIKNGVAIWEGVTIGDNVFVGPFVAFTNDLYPRSPRFALARSRYSDKNNWLARTVVEEGASIGCNATILCGIRIGKFSMIGAGAVVVKDVPPYALVYGVPSSVHGYVCECGQPLRFHHNEAHCASCNGRYQFIRHKVVRRAKGRHRQQKN